MSFRDIILSTTISHGFQKTSVWPCTDYAIQVAYSCSFLWLLWALSSEILCKKVPFLALVPGNSLPVLAISSLKQQAFISYSFVVAKSAISVLAKLVSEPTFLMCKIRTLKVSVCFLSNGSEISDEGSSPVHKEGRYSPSGYSSCPSVFHDSK